jgi:hypothetical protein
MEVLHVLEQKIADLLDVVRKTRADNARLSEENAELMTKLTACASDEQRRLQLAQETALTKSVVDGLIERINAFSESERQQ